MKANGFFRETRILAGVEDDEQVLHPQIVCEQNETSRGVSHRSNPTRDLKNWRLASINEI